jgi:hypothetical protein
MTINHPATIPESVCKTANVALFTAALALSTTAFGHTAVAIAEPEWDLGDYYDCVNHADPGLPADQVLGLCCIASGGQIVTKPNGDFVKCVAPPAAPAGSTQQLNPNLPQPTRETMPPGPGQPLPDQPAS